MILKVIGAICIILSCGGMGFSMAAAHRREEGALRQMISLLDHMGCELQYRLTPLPELCRGAMNELDGDIRRVLGLLVQELEQQLSADAGTCMRTALEKSGRLPGSVHRNLLMLGTSLGRYDLQGQLNGIEAVRIRCRSDLQELERNRENRLRSYQTLGLCAGFALAILFL